MVYGLSFAVYRRPILIAFDNSFDHNFLRRLMLEHPDSAFVLPRSRRIDVFNGPITAPNDGAAPFLSIVVPVFNGSQSIAAVVGELCAEFKDLCFEIVLVNDGSTDNSEQACLALVERYPIVTFIQLDGNFGEHSAVLAGLNHCRGAHVSVMDDDGQNRPADVRRMLNHLEAHGNDVVYVRYPRRHHSTFRVLGSWFNDRIATLLLKKPAGLYLSSFKVMNRSVVDSVRRTATARPYLDGSILSAARNIGQVTAEHRPRRAGKSGYTIGKLVDLWLSMVLGASVSRIQLLAFAGALIATLAILLGAGVVANWALFTPQHPVRVPFLELVALLASIAQLVALGFLGVYIRCLLLKRRSSKPYVLRYVRHPEGRTAQGVAPQPRGEIDLRVIAC